MERGPLTRRGPRPGRVITAVLAAVFIAGAAAWGGVRAWRARAAARPVGAPAPRVAVDDPGARAPAGVRVRVQVLNATRTRGLARRATRVLRDRGFDVVETGTWNAPRDSSLVLDRSGHPDWAARVARAVGGARVEARPDSSRYLDVTVLVGRTWRPPPEPFHP